jgi:hypothetical protein
VISVSSRCVVVVVWLTLTLIKWVGIDVAKRLRSVGGRESTRRDGINSEPEGRDVDWEKYEK